MMKPEPSEVTRRGAVGIIAVVVAALAAVLLEEIVEKFLHRRTGRQIGHAADARINLLRGRNIDHGVDHLLGDVGDVLRAPAAAGRAGRTKIAAVSAAIRPKCREK